METMDRQPSPKREVPNNELVLNRVTGLSEEEYDKQLASYNVEEAGEGEFGYIILKDKDTEKQIATSIKGVDGKYIVDVLHPDTVS